MPGAMATEEAYRSDLVETVDLPRQNDHRTDVFDNFPLLTVKLSCRFEIQASFKNIIH